MVINQYGENPCTPGVEQDVFTPDQLIAGPLQRVTATVTFAQGAAAKYKRGTVVGKITASGKYTLCVATAADGSQVPIAITVDDIDATVADVTGGVYLMGEFNQNRMTFDPTWTIATLLPALRPLAIFLKDSVQAPTVS